MSALRRDCGRWPARVLAVLFSVAGLLLAAVGALGWAFGCVVAVGWMAAAGWPPRQGELLRLPGVPRGEG